ncbi:MAG: polymer-forming cytoskeletal protein [Candidatus Saccharibacteria bacterium]|nr:polymer-forming cytoskeletal protein [Candidatus Saccharibacteria bacterium]
MKYIKIIALSLSLVFVSTLVFVGLASAQSFKAGETVGVAATETVNSMLFAAGNNVDIAGTVNGDVYCAGQTLTISGTVNGDVICAGQTIVISGPVNGSIRVAGQTITLSNTVSGSATIGAQTLVIDKNASIGRDLLGGSTNVTINGKVGRDIVAGARDLSINGTVGGNIKGATENLNIGSTGLVGGNVEYTSNNDPVIATGGKIVGTVTRTVPKKESKAVLLAPAVFSFGWFVYSLIAWIVLALVLVALSPRIFGEATELAKKKPGITTLIGVLGAILIPILVVMLFISIIGMPLAILTLLLWFTIMLLTTPFAGYMLGQLIMPKSKQPFGIMALGTGILVVTYFIPIIGFFTLLAAYLFGMGMILTRGKQLLERAKVVTLKPKTKKA